MNDILLLKRIDWSISAYKTIQENYYDVDWEFDFSIRWNILQYKRLIPYIAAEFDLIKNIKYDKIYRMEPGIKLKTGLYCILFYRFEYRTDVYPENGIFSCYNLLGIRLEI
jgi:hypothetical protein